MTRRKQQALDVPATAEEARGIMADYIGTERSMMSARLKAEMAIDAITFERDTTLAGLAAENEVRFRQIKAWWEAGGHKVLGDGGRSSKLAGARLGFRLTPPKVKFARGVKAPAVITWLKGQAWSVLRGCLRTKVELDKQAVIKAVQSEPNAKLQLEPLLTVVQDDEFFIDAGLDEEAMRKAIAGATEEWA